MTRRRLRVIDSSSEEDDNGGDVQQPQYQQEHFQHQEEEDDIEVELEESTLNLETVTLLEENLYHCSSLIAQTGQSMLRLHDQVLELNGTAKRYRTRADAALAKVQTAETRAEELRVENEKLKKELAEWGQRSDRRLEQVKADHAKELEEAREGAYNAGFAAAGEAYAGDILKLVKDGERKGFGKGYLHCCGVFGVAPEDPKFEAPAMPDSPAAEDMDDDEEEEVGTPDTEKSADGILSEKTSTDKIPAEGTSAGGTSAVGTSAEGQPNDAIPITP